MRIPIRTLVWSKWTVSVSVFALLFSVLIASVASAHASDFRTLTIDLLIGSQGLEAIDAAVVEAEGPSYGPFPSVEYREMAAVNVLDALGLDGDAVHIDAELSERYHEVGFTIRFPESSQRASLPLQFDTGQLQGVTSDLALEHLKLSVCGVDASLFRLFEIDASQSGRPSDPQSSERSWCEVWVLSPDDSPVSIAVSSPALAATGANLFPFAIGGFTLLGVGLLLLEWIRHSHPRSNGRADHSI